MIFSRFAFRKRVFALVRCATDTTGPLARGRPSGMHVGLNSACAKGISPTKQKVGGKSRNSIFRPLGIIVGAVVIVAERALLLLLDCRLGRRPAGAALAFECGAPSITLDIHLEDCRVMDKTVDRRECHRLIREDLAPCAERLICGDQH